jgi:hypothetical protein
MARIPGTTFHDSDPPKPKAMSVVHFMAVINSYVFLLEGLGIKPVRDSSTKENQLNHLLWMCHEASTFMKDGRSEKAMRWLGFIQGAFWALGVRSVDEMKKDNTE